LIRAEKADGEQDVLTLTRPD